MDNPTTIYIGLSILFTVVNADDVCEIDGSLRACAYGCCDIGSSQMCCLSPYTIAGIVFGCISIICAIAAIIFCLCKKKQQGQVVSVAPQPQHNVWVVNGSHNSSSQAQPYHQPYGQQPKNGTFPPTQPLPPGYASTYNNTYSSDQPPFGSSTVPPPAYSYHDPSNPFSAAAHASNSTSNSVYNRK